MHLSRRSLILRVSGLVALVAVVAIDASVQTLSVAGGVIAAITGVEVAKRRGKNGGGNGPA